MGVLIRKTCHRCRASCVGIWKTFRQYCSTSVRIRNTCHWRRPRNVMIEKTSPGRRAGCIRNQKMSCYGRPDPEVSPVTYNVHPDSEGASATSNIHPPTSCEHVDGWTDFTASKIIEHNLGHFIEFGLEFITWGAEVRVTYIVRWALFTGGKQYCSREQSRKHQCTENVQATYCVRINYQFYWLALDVSWSWEDDLNQV